MAFSSTWVKVSTQLPRHPKTIAAAASLGISVPELIGRLCMLWIYCAEFRPSGILSNAGELAAAMCWSGDASKLKNGLENIPLFGGFIEGCIDNDHDIKIHDWDIFNSAASSAEEKRREKKKREENARDARESENMTNQTLKRREIPPETRAALDKILKRNENI